LVHVKGGRIINIEGNPDSPISQGTLCPKGAATYQLAVNPNRITKVWYRPPGATEWVKDKTLDWAMDRIAELTKNVPISGGLLRFIGVSEVLGNSLPLVVSLLGSLPTPLCEPPPVRSERPGSPVSPFCFDLLFFVEPPDSSEESVEDLLESEDRSPDRSELLGPLGGSTTAVFGPEVDSLLSHSPLAGSGPSWSDSPEVTLSQPCRLLSDWALVRRSSSIRSE